MFVMPKCTIRWHIYVTCHHQNRALVSYKKKKIVTFLLSERAFYQLKNDTPHV